MEENKEQDDYVVIRKSAVNKLRNGIKNGWQMMLYCKIYAMSAQKGFCTATNKYFASFIGTTERNIQKYLSDLKAKGFIKIYEVKAGSHTESRKIYPQINPEENLNNPINLSNNNPPTSNHSSHPCPTVHPTHEQLGHDPRTVGSQPTNKWVVTHEQMDTQVIDSNSIVIDSNGDAAAVALLDVADAPERSASLAHQQKYNEIDFNGLIKNSDMPGIIQRQYKKLILEKELSIEEIVDSLLDEFTTGFYKCNRDAVKTYINYLVCKGE